MNITRNSYNKPTLENLDWKLRIPNYILAHGKDNSHLGAKEKELSAEEEDEDEEEEGRSAAREALG